MDGMNVALVSFNNDTVQCKHCQHTPYPQSLREEIYALCTPGNNEIERMGRLDRKIGFFMVEIVTQLLKDAKVAKQAIKAIGSHGQTIRHRPDEEYSFSLQIGDAHTLAQRTGIGVVADFRRRDIAAGGEGAPLAPIFHAQVFAQDHKTVCVVNIGGIANLSVINGRNDVYGFDCGPGNVLMDEWCAHHLKTPYDEDGAWAASGEVNNHLLLKLSQHPFINKAPLDPPRSSGREQFNLIWLQQVLAGYKQSIAPQDVQATLAEFTANSINQAIDKCALQHWKEGGGSLYVCGGGAHNKTLMARLQALCTPCSITTTAAIGIDADWVEAVAFAWFAKRHREGLSGNLPTVTGANETTILGCWYPPN